MRPPLRWHRAWAAIGVLLILAVITGSLIALPQAIPVAGIDKAHHLLAYGALMYWWGMVHPRRQWPWAAILIAMGLVLEGLQSLTPYRAMEWLDAVANMLGVVLALALLKSPAGGLLAGIDRKLGDRLDARAP